MFEENTPQRLCIFSDFEQHKYQFQFDSSINFLIASIDTKGESTVIIKTFLFSNFLKIVSKARIGE